MGAGIDRSVEPALIDVSAEVGPIALRDLIGNADQLHDGLLQPADVGRIRRGGFVAPELRGNICEPARAVAAVEEDRGNHSAAAEEPTAVVVNVEPEVD